MLRFSHSPVIGPIGSLAEERPCFATLSLKCCTFSLSPQCLASLVQSISYSRSATHHRYERGGVR